MPSGSAWYRRGLRFSCTGCGGCCSGEPGAVWVDDADVAAMAAHLGVSVEAFERRQVRAMGSRCSLMERCDGDCALLDAASRRCTVYPVRPRQCRSWPFWRANLQSPGVWLEVCRQCPGAGTGELHAVAEIARLRDGKR